MYLVKRSLTKFGYPRTFKANPCMFKAKFEVEQAKWQCYQVARFERQKGNVIKVVTSASLLTISDGKNTTCQTIVHSLICQSLKV
jgi:hypothetical protein